MTVPVFVPPPLPGVPADSFCPLHLYDGMVRLSPFARSRSFGPRSAAFHFVSGAPLDRKFMVRKTKELMVAAGISFVNDAGQKLDVLMASWRAGGVRSAVDAGLSTEMIKELGRWKSDAWTSYLLLSCKDLQGASRQMWEKSMVRRGPAGMQVGLFSAGGMFVSEENETAALVGRMSRL